MLLKWKQRVLAAWGLVKGAWSEAVVLFRGAWPFSAQCQCVKVSGQVKGSSGKEGKSLSRVRQEGLQPKQEHPVLGEASAR